MKQQHVSTVISSCFDEEIVSTVHDKVAQKILSKHEMNQLARMKDNFTLKADLFERASVIPSSSE